MKNMKHLAVVTLLTATAIFNGCKKDSTTPVTPTPTPTPAPTITAVPSTFSRKVLVEEFTGAWCGYCIDGALVLREMMEAQPKIIGVAFHEGDGMDNLTPSVWANSKFLSTWTFPGYPSGIVDRVPYNGTINVAIDRGSWSDAADIELAKTAGCGLAIDAKYNTAQDSAVITVHAGFNQTLSGNIFLTVYLVEDSVTGTGASYDQHNYYSSDYGANAAGGPSYPYYNLPAVVTGWEHRHVVRKIATANTGDAIPVANIVTGGEYVVTKTVVVKSTYNRYHLSAVAFIHKKGTTTTTHEVLNVQDVKIGSLQNWD